MSAEDALTKYYTKLHKKDQARIKRGSRKNKKPEKLVEAHVLVWAKDNGLDLTVVESKAVYSERSGLYMSSPTSESVCDLIGNYGALSIWIELKAKGRRSSLKMHQREFLLRKINAGCFACVTDRTDHLDKLFRKFISLNRLQGVHLLLEALPQHIDRDKNSSVDAEFGF